MPEEITASFCQQIIEKFDKKDLARPVDVIQEHHAKKLHWDLRFEIDNTLKSWALPKIPPEKEGERRLAVQVEDHPLEYALFEGEIPEGNYGAGQVTIWDRGTFVMMEREGKKLVVDVKGEKLKGKYCLLHFKPQEKTGYFSN